MQDVYAEDFSYPIVGYEIENGKVITKNLFGSSSYLNNNIFITAAHVIKNAQECEYGGIAFRESPKEGSKYTYHKIKKVELFKDNDIGLVEIEDSHPNAKAYNWSLEKCSIFEDVYTIGFPHGFDFEEKNIIARGLKGYVVGGRRFREFPGKPEIYELSFHCPRGISGASLLTDDDPTSIKGFIIANSLNEMVVFSETEIDEEKGERTIFEKRETTKFGVAIQSHDLFDLNSKILGMRFRDYLTQEGLLI